MISHVYDVYGIYMVTDTTDMQMTTKMSPLCWEKYTTKVKFPRFLLQQLSCKDGNRNQKFNLPLWSIQARTEIYLVSPAEQKSANLRC